MCSRSEQRRLIKMTLTIASECFQNRSVYDLCSLNSTWRAKLVKTEQKGYMQYHTRKAMVIFYKQVPYSQCYLFKAKPDPIHNANITNPSGNRNR